jgi:hypothetical protein
MTRHEAWNLAGLWVAAWNAHDLDLIMAHYEDAVELTSPVAAQLLGTSDGRVIGKANVRAYFRRGLEAYPDLNFRLADVLWGIECGALLHKPQGDAHSRVYGIVSDREGGKSCGELQCVENWNRPRVYGISRNAKVGCQGGQASYLGVFAVNLGKFLRLANAMRSQTDHSAKAT